MKNPSSLSKWVKAVKRKNWTPSIHTRICSVHFVKSDYQIRPGYETPRLREAAVPSIFNFPSNYQQKKSKFTSKSKISTERNVETDQIHSELTTPRPQEKEIPSVLIELPKSYQLKSWKYKVFRTSVKSIGQIGSEAPDQQLQEEETVTSFTSLTSYLVNQNL